ncbi:MAG: hypothetical protein K2K64_02160 [Muribaculaceae bacterium]|nr:hypothetical protein [Muribaculaceae bacterium]
MSKKKIMGITLLIIGVACIIGGCLMLISSDSNRKGTHEQNLNNSLSSSNTVSTPSHLTQESHDSRSSENISITPSANNNDDISNQSDLPSSNSERQSDSSDGKDRNETDTSDDKHAKGVEFEKFIISRFGKQFWSIKDWRGDKSMDGRYSESSMYPDLEMKLSLKGKEYVVAIECKWRNNFNNERKIKWSYSEQFERYKKYAEKTGYPVFVAIGIGGVPSKPDNIYLVPLSAMTSYMISERELKRYLIPSDKLFFYDTAKSDFNR